MGARGLAAALLLASSGCAAHLPRADERVPFMERSYLSISNDRREAFEVAPALHIVVRNGLDASGVLETGGITTSLSLSFIGTLRVFREDSTPVRTPTYEPRARIQVFAVGQPDAEGEALSEGGGPPWLAALEATVGHRSNGQQGCALADHVRTGKGDFDCLPATDPPSDRLNLSTGSFTTNYVGVGLGALWQIGGGDARTIVSARSSVEWNVPCGLGACMPEPMRGRYGAVVGRVSAEVELPALWHVSGALPLVGVESDIGLRLALTGSRHLGTIARPTFGDATAEVALLSRARQSLGIGLFVRRHQGRDDLNIRFEERLDAWIAGIVVDPGARP